MTNWPNFFIVGAPRCGTTSLYEYLNQIPEIFMSQVKEPNYFSVNVNPDLKASKVIREENQYLNLFKNVKDEIAIGEATPDYLWDPEAPSLIHDVIPNAKIIISLRDPIERAFSHYLLLLSIGMETSSFSDAIKNAQSAKPDYSGRIVECGNYFKQVKRYIDIFGLDNLKIIIFEEFIHDERNHIKKILNFLDVHSDPPTINIKPQNPFTMPRENFAIPIISNSNINRLRKKIVPRSFNQILRNIFTKKSVKPKLSSTDRKELEGVYRNDVLKLQDLLNRIFPWSIP